jgi:hypothetical protein
MSRKTGRVLELRARSEGRAAMKLLVLTAFYTLVFGGILALLRMARADADEWRVRPLQKGQPCATSTSDW